MPMQKTAVRIALVALAVAAALAVAWAARGPARTLADAPADAAPQWLTSMPDAVAAANASGKVILADFTGSDWCGWCKRLKAEVFDTPEFKAWAAKNVILLELDFPRAKDQSDELKKQNKELAKKYAVRGFPTILFLKASGEAIGKTGYMKGGPKPWLENADEILKAAK